MILHVNEIFGVTIQGEGQNIGQPCIFLRLAGCNLACVWCDTPYTWDWKRFDKKIESIPMTIGDVADKLRAFPNNPKHLVISGGEPMLQQSALAELCNILQGEGWYIEIETAGTIAPIAEFAPNLFTVSPKLEHSGNDMSKRHKPDALKALQARPHAFKFVVSSNSDFAEVDRLVNDVGATNVYVMPLGITEPIVTSRTAELIGGIIERGYKLSTRLHVLIWGNKRGV